ncbi:MAG: DUF1583 domain-containing protein [Planctomycetaceae bacterium]|nr:DUF1583 domain-containing protein [Planctomycetaceae bacterium]
MTVRIVPTWPALFCMVLILPCGVLKADDTASGCARSLGFIFDDDHVSSSGNSVLERSAHMEPDAAFRALTAWVLPGLDHHSLRFQVHSVTDTTAESGSRLESPVLQLIRLAKELGRLDSIRARLETAAKQSGESDLNLLAMLVIIDCDQQQVETAAARLTSIFDRLSQSSSPVDASMMPILLMAGIAGEHDSLRPIARDLVLHLMVKSAATLSDAEWKLPQRLLTRLAESLQDVAQNAEPPADAEAEADTEAEAASADHQAGDNESTTLRTLSASDTGWRSFAVSSAEATGCGYPTGNWIWDGTALRKWTIHHRDYLCFQSPLTGHYSLEFDAAAFSMNNIQPGVGSFWARTSHALDHVLTGLTNSGAQQTIVLEPPLTKGRPQCHGRVVVTDRHVEFRVNGRLVTSCELSPGHSPWLTFAHPIRQLCELRNARISGQPVIPSTISLSGDPELSGWVPWFSGDDSTTAGWSLRSTPTEPPMLSSLRRKDLADGAASESLLQYYRPMLEDGTIRYQFYFEPGLVHVHPALGRMVFLLEPDGIRRHQVTNGHFDVQARDPLNSVSLNSNPLSNASMATVLKPGEWNTAELRIQRDIIRLSLNGRLVLQEPIDIGNSRHFGLFHYADQTEARVKDVQWSGSWPTELPPADQQPLADQRPLLHDKDAAAMQTLHYRFGSDATNDESIVMQVTEGQASDIQTDAAGIRLATRSGTRYSFTTLSSLVGMSGDFDALLEFDDLETHPGVDGNCSITLQIMAGTSGQWECNLRRRHNRYNGERPDQQLVYTDTVIREAGPERRNVAGFTPAEAKGGILRVSRRGNTLNTWHAEPDSDVFQLIEERRFSEADILPGNIRIRAHGFAHSEVSVRVRSLKLTADRILKSAESTHIVTSETLEQLNARRAKLPLFSDQDFAVAAPDDSIWSSYGDIDPWLATDGGLLISHTGEARWGFSSLRTRKALSGDFSVTANFELKNIENPDAGKESTIYLKINFSDEERSQIGTMFEQTIPGQRSVFARIGHPKPGGRYLFRPFGTVVTDNVVELRIQRYGSQLVFLMREDNAEQERIIAAAEVTDAPIYPGGLLFLVHTGGLGRRTTALLKRLTVHGSVDTPVSRPILNRSPLLQPKPATIESR